MFLIINPDLIYCIDDEKDYIFLHELQNNYKNCSIICIEYNSKKYIIENNLCIDSCSSDKYYKYEYNNICYNECPENTHISSYNSGLCEDDKCKYFYKERDQCQEIEGYYLD
jgi:hypothetical protein